jgi:hypothetical protein
MKTAFEDRTMEYEVGGKTLAMRPLSLKELQKALQVVERASQQLVATGPKDPAEFIRSLPAILVGKFKELAPILFPGQDMPEGWIEENFDVPKAKKVILDAAEINEVTNFLVKLQSRMGPTTPESRAA